jgi:hypothetical protein
MQKYCVAENSTLDSPLNRIVIPAPGSSGFGDFKMGRKVSLIKANNIFGSIPPQGSDVSDVTSLAHSRFPPFQAFSLFHFH